MTPSVIGTYRASPTKRYRRTKREVAVVREAIHDILAADNPMTVRQVFYQLVSRGAIEKTEAEYKHTVIRLLLDMRRSGEIPYGYIADYTRWQRKPQTWDSLGDMLASNITTYRRALWTDRPDRVEVWLEKEALAGVVMQETAPWDVPLMVSRGYPSESFVFTAAEAIRDAADHRQYTYIYYFGDYDPSGLDISRSTEEKLSRFVRPRRDAVDLEVERLIGRTLRTSDCFSFQRVAVTEEQRDEWNLPTRPTKATDSRAGGFEGESVELDAIPARQLRDLVREHIEGHVDQDALKRTLAIEQAERESLRRFARRLRSRGAA